MRKFVKLSMIALAASLAVGCATNSDIENLQGQIDGLKTDVAKASSDASSALAAANDASSRAAAAEAAANRAADAAQATNDKLDRLFHKTMMK
jgi:murein lipoprotein